MTNEQRFDKVKTWLHQNALRGDAPTGFRQLYTIVLKKKTTFHTEKMKYDKSPKIMYLYQQIELISGIDMELTAEETEKANRYKLTVNTTVIEPYVYRSLNRFGNTVISKMIVKQRGVDDILDELLSAGYDCTLKLTNYDIWLLTLNKMVV